MRCDRTCLPGQSLPQRQGSGLRPHLILEYVCIKKFVSSVTSSIVSKWVNVRVRVTHSRNVFLGLLISHPLEEFLLSFVDLLVCVYAPAMNVERTGDEGDDTESTTETEIESEEDDEFRNELVSEFSEATENDSKNTRRFGDLLSEIREEEAQRDLPGNEEDTKLYILFETNHPDLELPDEESEENEYSEVENTQW